jgi:hypothetical protein
LNYISTVPDETELQNHAQPAINPQLPPFTGKGNLLFLRNDYRSAIDHGFTDCGNSNHSNKHGLLRMKWITDCSLCTLRNVLGHKLNENHEIISVIFKNNNMNVRALQCAAENPVITRYK